MSAGDEPFPGVDWPGPRLGAREALVAPDVLGFRQALDAALNRRRPGDPPWAPAISDARWGVYAFYDYEHEPIYVGQTNERLRVRVRRHLTNQRTDAVGMRVLDPYEVEAIELWPLPAFDAEPAGDTDETCAAELAERRRWLNRLERTVYERAVSHARFGVILNEKIPPRVPTLEPHELPPAYRFSIVPEEVRAEREHLDNRVARRAEALARLASVVRERGVVSAGLRRVLVVQAARLAWLGAQRLAQAEGRRSPTEDALDLRALVGPALDPDPDPDPDTDPDEPDDPDDAEDLGGGAQALAFEDPARHPGGN